MFSVCVWAFFSSLSLSATSAVIVPFEIPPNSSKRERLLLLLGAYLVSQAFPDVGSGRDANTAWNKRSTPLVIKMAGSVKGKRAVWRWGQTAWHQHTELLRTEKSFSPFVILFPGHNMHNLQMQRKNISGPSPFHSLQKLRHSLYTVLSTSVYYLFGLDLCRCFSETHEFFLHVC